MGNEIYSWLTPKIRTWIYSMLLAGIPLLIAYGVLDEQTAPLWVALGAAVLGQGMALAHTPRGEGRHVKPDIE